MKKRQTIKYSQGIAAAGAAALATALNGHAQAPDSFYDHFYIGAGGGVALAQSISSSVDDYPFPAHMPSYAIKFDTGWRADVYAGYSFCRYFSAQLDSGVIWNDLTTLGGDPLSGGASARLEQVPLLAEGLFSYPLGQFKPYLLAGAGADFGIFQGSSIPGGPSNYNSTDTTFAYEAGLGCTYALTRHLEIGMDYKFLGTTDHSWNSGGFNLKTGGTMEHTIEAKLSWRF